MSQLSTNTLRQFEKSWSVAICAFCITKQRCCSYVLIFTWLYVLKIFWIQREFIGVIHIALLSYYSSSIVHIIWLQSFLFYHINKSSNINLCALNIIMIQRINKANISSLHQLRIILHLPNKKKTIKVQYYSIMHFLSYSSCTSRNILAFWVFETKHLALRTDSIPNRKAFLIKFNSKNPETSSLDKIKLYFNSVITLLCNIPILVVRII